MLTSDYDCCWPNADKPLTKEAILCYVKEAQDAIAEELKKPNPQPFATRDRDLLEATAVRTLGSYTWYDLK